jgi:environmental stress-induced protein Ves
MQIIRKTSFTAVPWKNGGGITHEALRVPPSGDPFRWRVSVAEIASSGPFSDFADYRRKMVLLQGAGLRLTFDGTEHRVLREVGDLVEFDGARATSSELLGGPCTDLNLMVSKSVPASHAWVESLQAPRELSGFRGTTLVFPICGAVSMAGADRQPATLEAWDLAVLAPGDAVCVSPATPGASTVSLVFFATLEDNLG